MIKSDFRELYQFVNNWEKHVDDFGKFLEDFFLEQVREVIAGTRERTPIDTGDLQAAWKIVGIRRSGGDLEVEIANMQPYASFVEFGARNVNGSWRDGRFMFAISLDEVMKKMPDNYHEDFKAWLTKNGLA